MSGKPPGLLPCPFCGSEAQVKSRNTVMVTCTKCSAATFQRLDDADSAIAAWNTRSPSAYAFVARDAVLEEAAREMDRRRIENSNEITSAATYSNAGRAIRALKARPDEQWTKQARQAGAN